MSYSPLAKSMQKWCISAMMLILPSIKLYNFLGLYVFGFACVMAGWIVILWSGNFRLKRKDTAQLITILALALAIFSYYTFDYYRKGFALRYYILSIYPSLLIISYYFFISFFYKTYGTEGLKSSIRAILAINVIFFYIQFSIYHTSGFVLDLNSLLGGFQAGMINEAYTDFGFRGSGFYLEPSIYAAHIAIYTFLYLYYGGNNTPLIIACLLSMILCNSTVANFLAVPFLIYITIQKKSLFWLIIPLAIAALIYQYEMISSRALMFTDGRDHSSSHRLDIMNMYLSDIDLFLWGYGFIEKVNLAQGSSLDAVGDHTFLLNPLIIYGSLIGSIILLLYLKLFSKFRLSKLGWFTLAFLLAKFPAIYFPGAWIFIFSLMLPATHYSLLTGKRAKKKRLTIENRNNLIPSK